MNRTTHGTFDGEVLRLEDAAGLEVNQRYRVTIETEPEPPAEQPIEERYSALLDIANDLGISDFADKLKK